MKGFDRPLTEAIVRTNTTAGQLFDLLRQAESEGAGASSWWLPEPLPTCSPASWYYFSVPANQTGVGQAVRAQLDVAALAQHVGAASVHSENVWIGGGGVMATNHYDASHNVFVQLHGRKRFVLSDPVASERDLSPYSFLHPRFRRTQRRPHGAAEDGTDGLSPEHTQTVVLEAGDAMLLPPFVFHEVTALPGSLSVSFNLWAHDGALREVKLVTKRAGRRLGLLPHLDRLTEAFTSQSGATDEGASNQRAQQAATRARQAKASVVEAAAVALVEAALTRGSDAPLAAAAAGGLAARAWLHERMRSRWQSVLATYPRAMTKLARFCSPDEQAVAARHSIAASHMPNAATAAINDVASILRSLRAAGGEALETANFVEQLAFDVLGDARTTGAFLTHCFQ